MSGIFGFRLQADEPRPGNLLEAMRNAVPPPGEFRDRSWIHLPDGRVGLGTRKPAVVSERGSDLEFQNGPNRMVCVLDGYIFAENPSDTGGHRFLGAEWIIGRYRDHGSADFLPSLRGSFAFALWDEAAGRLILGTDNIGQRLLFYSYRDGNLLFASVPGRILGSGRFRAEIDPEAVADLAHFEHVLGERTLFRDLHTLPPGGVLVQESGPPSLRAHNFLNGVEPHGRLDAARMAAVEEAFLRAMDRCLPPDERPAIDLTGGMDSRTLLAGAVHLKRPFLTHTAGFPDSTDVVLARRASRLVGADHFFEPICTERLAEWLVPMVAYQGGTVATLFSHPCQHFFLDFPFSSEIQGIGTAFIRSHWTSAEALQIGGADEAVEFVRPKMETPTARNLSPDTLWRGKFVGEAPAWAEGHLRAMAARWQPRGTWASLVEFMDLERSRKLFNKALAIVRGTRDVFLPLMDHDLLETLTGIPVEDRATRGDRFIELALIRRLCPDLLRVPLEKTLLRPDIGRRPEIAIRKFRRWSRRMAERLAVSLRWGRRVPNHAYDRWAGEGMRPFLEELLLGKEPGYLEFFRESAARDRISAHLDGKERWTALVSCIAVLEIAHRTWVREDPLFKRLLKTPPSPSQAFREKMKRLVP